MTMMLFPPEITSQNSFTSMDVTPQDYDAYDVLEERQSSSETRAPLSTTALSTLLVVFTKVPICLSLGSGGLDTFEALGRWWKAQDRVRVVGAEDFHHVHVGGG